MSRIKDSRESTQGPADWYQSFEAELACHGLSAPEVRRTTASTRAEAETAGVPPNDPYGPAVLYAREVASALRDFQATAPAPTAATPVALRLTEVSARRGRRTVLSGINLTVRQGEVVAVVRANGAGKSILPQGSHRSYHPERARPTARRPRAGDLLSLTLHLCVSGDRLDRRPTPVDRPKLGDSDAGAAHADLVPVCGPSSHRERDSAVSPAC